MDRPRHQARNSRVQAGAVPAWTRLVAASLARALVVLAVSLGAWSALPALIGWEPTTVVSASMAPKIMVGDVIVAKPVEPTQVKIGQVLLVDDPDRAGELRLHRLADLDDAGQLVLRGDANAQDDSSPVPPSAVHGVAVVRVPWAGLPGLWLSEGHTVRVAGLALALLVALGLARADRDLRRGGAGDGEGAGTGGDTGDDAGTDVDGGATPPKAPTSHRDPEHDHGLVPGLARVAASSARSLLASARRPLSTLLPHHGRHRTPVALRRAVPVAALGLLAISIGVAVPSNAAVSAKTISPPSTLAANPWFTCEAAVSSFGQANTYLWYKLDDTAILSNVVADSSGNNRTAQANGLGYSRGQPRACARDTGSSFTLGGILGTWGYITMTGNQAAAPATFTLQTWFKTTVAQGKVIGFDSTRAGSNGTNDRHLYVATTGQLVFGVNPGTPRTISTPGAVTDGQWHLATASLSSAGMRLYLDGNLVASDTSTTTAATYDGWWRVGWNSQSAFWPNSSSTSYFSGSLDEVAVFTSALTGDEVKAMYEAGR